MITFLASPKPFVGVSERNQRNAILSWRRVHPDVEVILYGDSAGTAEVSAELGLRHVSDVPSSPSGIPYFDAIVADAHRHGRHQMQMYVNCDILLTSAVLDALRVVKLPRYLMIGQRIDLPPTSVFELDRTSWPACIDRLIDLGAELHPPSGIDYFIFTRGLWEGLPPLVIGRAGYDSALVAFCLRQRIPIIDATVNIPALHQYHDYAHVPGRVQEVWGGVDAMQNRRLHDVAHSAPNIIDADWRLVEGMLSPNRARGDYLRRLERFLRFRLALVRVSHLVRIAWRILTTLRLYSPPRLTLADLRLEAQRSLVDAETQT